MKTIKIKNPGSFKEIAMSEEADLIGGKKMVYCLAPIHENVESYYGKALVENSPIENTLKLYSYGTLVAIIKDGEIYVTHKERDLSHTTLRHIKEFLIQAGEPKSTKKQLLEKYKDLK